MAHSREYAVAGLVLVVGRIILANAIVVNA
jgi:hypothetical protein